MKHTTWTTADLLSALVATLVYQGAETTPDQQRAGPGSSHDGRLSSAALSMRRYRQRMRQNPHLHAVYKQRQMG